MLWEYTGKQLNQVRLGRLGDRKGEGILEQAMPELGAE